MQEKRSYHINGFFHGAFLIWLVVGAVLQLGYSGRQLFHFLNGTYSDFADKLMPYVTLMGQAEFIVPALLLPLLVVKEKGWYFLLAASCNLLPLLLQQWLKRTYHLPRPLNYFHHAPWIHWRTEWPELMWNSFPSGHTQGAFSFFCFLSLLIGGRFRWLGAVFFVLALIVGYSRIYLAAHFFADVYVGSIIGVFITTVLYNLLYRFNPLGGQFRNV